MIDGLVAGRLHAEVEQRIDKTGKRFTVAKVLADTSDGEKVFVNVIAFDNRVCAALHSLRDGDALSLAGSLVPKVWTDKQANVRPALDMVAHRILAARED